MHILIHYNFTLSKNQICTHNHSLHPILLNPVGRVVLRFGLPGEADHSGPLGQFFLGVGQEVHHLARVQHLDVVRIGDGHLQPEIEPHDALVNVLEVLLQDLVDGHQQVVVPDHDGAVVALFVVLLAGQVARPQGCELAPVLEQLVQVAGDDHVQVDVEFPALDAVVLEQGHLAPPLLPALLQRHGLDLRVQTSAVLSEAVEIETPAGISLDAGIEFVNVGCWVPRPPLDAQYADVLLSFFRLSLPVVDLQGFKTLILGLLLLGQGDNMLPGAPDGLLLASQLPQNISKIDHGLLVVRVQLQRLFAILVSFVYFVHLDVHDCQVGVGVDIGSLVVELGRVNYGGEPLLVEGALLGELVIWAVGVVGGELQGFEVVDDGLLVVASLAVQVAQVHLDVGVGNQVLVADGLQGFVEVVLGLVQVVGLEAEATELVVLEGDDQVVVVGLAEELGEEVVGVLLALLLEQLHEHGLALLGFLGRLHGKIFAINNLLKYQQVSPHHEPKQIANLAKPLPQNPTNCPAMLTISPSNIIIQHPRSIPTRMSTLGLMLQQLAKNLSTPVLKQVIAQAAKKIQQRVYWLNIAQDDGSFMQQYWDRDVQVGEVMKKRIARITEEKFEELFAEVDRGRMQGRQDKDERETIRIGNLDLSVLAQDVPIYNAQYFKPDHPKTKETKAKLRQIHEQQMKFREKIQQLKKKQQAKRRQKQQLDEQLKRSIQKQKKQRYKQHVFKTIEQKQRAQTQRKQQHQKYSQFLQAYKTTKPLHVLMQQQYKQKIELPMLEQNRKKLEQYRQFRQKVKPTLEEINEHELSYMEYKSGRQSRIVIANKTIDVSFKSKFYLQEQKKFSGEDEGYETLFDQVEKKKRYSDMIKENYKPRVSEKLRESLIASQLKHSTAKESLDRAAQIERGKKYLQFMRSLEKNRKQHSSPNENTSEPKQSHRYIDYLQDLKQSRQVQDGESGAVSGWERDMRDRTISDYERRERVLMKSKQLEEKAQRREQIINNNSYHRAEQIIQGKREIDQALISSIRAKVAVLRDAQQP